VFVDQQGFIGFTESVAFMSALAVKRSGKKKVAATVETGKLLDMPWPLWGGRLCGAKVGDVPVAHLAREIDAAIGIESIGVYIMPELGLYPNSIAAALTLLSAVKDIFRNQGVFSVIVRRFTGQRKMPCANEKKEALKTA